MHADTSESTTKLSTIGVPGSSPAPSANLAHHFPRHRALRLHRESASGCRAAEDFGERHEFAVLDDATRTTAREQSAEVRGLQLYIPSRERASEHAASGAQTGGSTSG